MTGKVRVPARRVSRLVGVRCLRLAHGSVQVDRAMGMSMRTGSTQPGPNPKSWNTLTSRRLRADRTILCRRRHGTDSVIACGGLAYAPWSFKHQENSILTLCARNLSQSRHARFARLIGAGSANVSTPSRRFASATPHTAHSPDLSTYPGRCLAQPPCRASTEARGSQA